MFRFVLSPFKDLDESARLRAYLDDITQDGISDEALQKLWWSSSADIVFRDTAYLRSMLRELRDRL